VYYSDLDKAGKMVRKTLRGNQAVVDQTGTSRSAAGL